MDQTDRFVYGKIERMLTIVPMIMAIRLRFVGAALVFSGTVTQKLLGHPAFLLAGDT